MQIVYSHDVSENEIGLREGRVKFGDLVTGAEHHGEITYVTRHGRRVAAIVPINRIAKEPVVRTVHSTVDRVDPTVTPDIAEAVRDAVEKGTVERKSSCLEYDSEYVSIRVVAFELDGQERWAMFHEDNSQVELIDSADRDEIVALYEKQVRGLVTFSEWTFDETDVELPHTLISATSGDVMPDGAEELAESDFDWDDLPEDAQAWASEQGYGRDDEELLYIMPGEVHLEGWPTRTVQL